MPVTLVTPPIDRLPPPDPSGRHAGVQGLRGLCVLAVFAYHVINSGLLPMPDSTLGGLARWFADSLRYGVEVFFMISGYVIVISLRRHASIAAFARDRLLRIFPLWLPLALAMWIAQQALAWRNGTAAGWGDSAVGLVANLLLLPPLVPLHGVHPASWSLSYELVFYAVAMLAWATRDARGLRGWLWLVPAALFIAQFPRGLFFVPGVLLALLEPTLAARRPSTLRHGWIGLPLFLVGWLWTGVNEAGWRGDGLAQLLAQGHGPAIALAFAGALWFFAWVVLEQRDPPSGRRSLFHTGFILWLGTISYSFYLVHPIVMAGVKRGLVMSAHVSGWWAPAALAAIALPLSCLASWASWRLFETGLRRWLQARLPSPRHAAPRRIAAAGGSTAPGRSSA